MAWPNSSPTRIPRQPLRSIHRRAFRSLPLFDRFGFLLFGIPVLLIYAIIALVDPAPQFDTALTVIYFGMYAAFLVSVVIVGRRIRKHAPRAIALAFLEACLCPSCGYELRGLPTEEDGCTVCPECGAAWRVPGSGTPVPPDSGKSG